jgi:ankyrin repeat protein
MRKQIAEKSGNINESVKREGLVNQALCFAIGFVGVLGLIQAQTAEDLFRAIRAGDLDRLRQVPANLINSKDRLETTPLHYAALYGNAESVRILLDRGADPKARNKSEATPLIYAAYNFDKTRLLVEKGSDVNAHSASGMTPLLVAVSVHGNAPTVRYLIEKGADVKAVGPLGSDPLQTAAMKGDAEMIRLLLQKGADPLRKDQAGFTALLNAFSVTDPERVKMLVTAGSDINAANSFSGAVKNGPIALVHMTPVYLAAPDSDPATVKTLLGAGARPNEPDIRKMTPLMLAVATDYPKLGTIRQLIAAGADVNAKDQNGDSVYCWALKSGNPEVLAILTEAGATREALPATPKQIHDGARQTPKEAVAKSTALLVKSGETFFTDGGGCVGCHHQPLMGRAFAALRAANQNPDERLHRLFLNSMVATRPALLSGLPLQTARGGDYDEFLSQVPALAELGEPASASTDAIVHYLAGRQEPSGAWYIAGGPRAPMESSSISRTALAIFALKTYGWPARSQEFDERIARARTWLQAAKAGTSYEQADRIMGLKAAGVPENEIEKSAHALIKEQRSDGGWSQNPYLQSDAYATGLVLSTLYKTGSLKPGDAAYQSGVRYLLDEQRPDGSWPVSSRSPKLQPYFQSAFPYDHNQWISAAATAYAVMALAPATH